MTFLPETPAKFFSLYRKRPVYIYSAVQTCIPSPSPHHSHGNSSLFRSKLKGGVKYSRSKTNEKKKSRKLGNCVSWKKAKRYIELWSFENEKRNGNENYERNCHWIANILFRSNENNLSLNRSLQFLNFKLITTRLINWAWLSESNLFISSTCLYKHVEYILFRFISKSIPAKRERERNIYL